MRDQFIAGLTSETLRVNLISKGHRHRDAALTKVKLREVVEIAKSSIRSHMGGQQCLATGQLSTDTADGC